LIYLIIWLEFTTHVLKGSYKERVYSLSNDKKDYIFYDKVWEEGTSHFVPAYLIHEIIELAEGDCFTLIRPEPKTRDTHFWKFEDGKIYNRVWHEKDYKVIISNE